jgi:serine/threonine protein kinase
LKPKLGVVKRTMKLILIEKIVACKTIQFFENQVKKFAVRDECEILETLQHPNIVRFYDVQWDAFQARLYMENCEGGNLDQFVGKHLGYIKIAWYGQIADRFKGKRIGQARKMCGESHSISQLR